jgi:hypothetical protein
MHSDTPGVQASPAISGGVRGTQMRTELVPSTHSSFIAHCASVMQVARQVVAPPIASLQVVLPRHRVMPIMHG